VPPSNQAQNPSNQTNTNLAPNRVVNAASPGEITSLDDGTPSVSRTINPIPAQGSPLLTPIPVPDVFSAIPPSISSSIATPTPPPTPTPTPNTTPNGQCPGILYTVEYMTPDWPDVRSKFDLCGPIRGVKRVPGGFCPSGDIRYDIYVAASSCQFPELEYLLGVTSSCPEAPRDVIITNITRQDGQPDVCVAPTPTPTPTPTW